MRLWAIVCQQQGLVYIEETRALLLMFRTTISTGTTGKQGKVNVNLVSSSTSRSLQRAFLFW